MAMKARLKETEESKKRENPELPRNCFLCEVGGMSCSYRYGSKGCIRMNKED